MGRLRDLTGKRFGHWTVLEMDSNRVTYKSGGIKVLWICKCDCGNVKTVLAGNLLSEKSTNCGCTGMEKFNKAKKTHGKSRTPLYITWCNMKNRCGNPNYAEYSRYGGRGITICEEWEHDFESFQRWAIENGYKEGLSIDRIDVDKEYSPDNCQWLTRSDNSKKLFEDKKKAGEVRIGRQWIKKE